MNMAKRLSQYSQELVRTGPLESRWPIVFSILRSIPSRFFILTNSRLACGYQRTSFRSRHQSFEDLDLIETPRIVFDNTDGRIDYGRWVL